MKKRLKDYFTLNKIERRGTFVLLLILLLVLVINILLPYFKQHQKFDFLKFENEIIAFESTQKLIEEARNSYKKDFNFNDVDRSAAEIKLSPFPFNPNNLPFNKWQEMGLSDKQINVIKNYEAKGGKFYKKEDLKKIYGISENEYNILEPYINITESYKSFSKFKDSKEYESYENVVVELNSATAEELMKLKGIGPSFSKRIIGYRKLIGGYSSKEQLLEVYGFDSLRYEGIAENIEVNLDSIKKININKASYEKLRKHPYFNYDVSFAITNYKYKHGNFKSIDDLLKIKSMNDSLFEKIKVYIKIED